MSDFCFHVLLLTFPSFGSENSLFLDNVQRNPGIFFLKFSAIFPGGDVHAEISGNF